MKELISKWYDAGIIKVISKKDPSGWVLKSGVWSPIYINFRVLGYNPELFKETIDRLISILSGKTEQDTIVMGIPTMGAYLAAVVAYETGRPLQAIQMTNKKYGITTDVAKAPSIILIDDVLTSGYTIREHLEPLFQVRGMAGIYTYVLVDRRKEQTKLTFSYRAITTLDEIYTTIKGQLDPIQQTMIEWYLENR